MTSQLPHINWSHANFLISTDPDLLDVAVIHWYLSEQSYWASGVEMSTVERSIQHSLCFGVYACSSGRREQIGFARVITDLTRFAYLADVFIIPAYQSQGLGKWLVETILQHPELQTVRRWMLHTADAHVFYRRLGFDTGRDVDKYMAYLPLDTNKDERIVEE